MADLRWELAERPKAQGTLFEEPVFEREPGRGEFRGMEFLHVRANRIINEVPGAPFGFRYSINAYRGCSHSCTYCLAGETPILLADGRTRPIADLRRGDVVYGTLRDGDDRRYVPSTVLDQWATAKPAYRVTLDDGTQLVASGDHRFLTDRGWKHVIGTGSGAGQRPHLTTNNSMLGVGAFAATPKMDADYRQGYLCGMIRGDGHLGSSTYPRPRRTSNDVFRFRLALVDDEALVRSQDYLESFGISTDVCLHQVAAGQRQAIRAIRTQAEAKVEAITGLIAWPSTPSDEWKKGFLAGIFDAEGSASRGILRISNTDSSIIDRIELCLQDFGFGYVVEASGRANGLRTVRLTGGLRHRLRFFHTVEPAITRKRTIDGVALESDAPLRVTAVESLGLTIPMFDITTSTGDFIADGVVSHNCFARPTHSYLNLDPGEDFERRIVVKVNAVSALRRELDARRWRGDLIAMGTNTDPYQRCEGKYRLTRGIIEVLSEAANPFSILTKSTLVLRDLPLLVEAAKRTEVRVNLSIGTLDEAVWRATEPGTPHPQRRVRAVETLNAAGIPCGVLMAPILPDLSDGPDQLEAVVRACLNAGARSLAPVLLHLRPGVPEVFLARLAVTHPHLVAGYRRRYQDRSHLPRADQQTVNALVRELVRKYGGVAESIYETTEEEDDDPPEQTVRGPRVRGRGRGGAAGGAAAVSEAVPSTQLSLLG